MKFILNFTHKIPSIPVYKPIYTVHFKDQMAKKSLKLMLNRVLQQPIESSSTMVRAKANLQFLQLFLILKKVNQRCLAPLVNFKAITSFMYHSR